MWRELCRGCLVWFRCRVDRCYRSYESFSFWNLDGVSCLVGSCSSCPWLWIVVFDVHHDETLRALRVHFSTRYGVSFEMIFLPFCKIGGLVLGRIKADFCEQTFTCSFCSISQVLQDLRTSAPLQLLHRSRLQTTANVGSISAILVNF